MATIRLPPPVSPSPSSDSNEEAELRAWRRRERMFGAAMLVIIGTLTALLLSVLGGSL